MQVQTERIGIIAGSGQFPKLVARGAKAYGASVFICGFNGHTEPELAMEAEAFKMLHIGQLNKLIAFFKQYGVQKLCMAGAIKKAKVLDFRPDLRAAKLFFALRQHGDDAILRGVAAELEAEGMHLLQAAELVPGLRAPEGLLTRRKPDESELASINFGWPLARELGKFDIGQCLILKKKMVVAVEALEGTDETLERGGTLGGKGCIMLKMTKTGQDERLDLPALGKTTIELLVMHKYSCLAYEAGRTLFFDREESIALANKHKIAIIGLTDQNFI